MTFYGDLPPQRHITAIADSNTPGWSGDKWIMYQRTFRAICCCGWQAKYWHCWPGDEDHSLREAEADAVEHRALHN